MEPQTYLDQIDQSVSPATCSVADRLPSAPRWAFIDSDGSRSLSNGQYTRIQGF
jgi:hypothetical protein